MGCIVRNRSQGIAHAEHLCATCKHQGNSVTKSFPCKSCFPWETGYPQNLKHCQWEASDALHPTDQTDT